MILKINKHKNRTKLSADNIYIILSTKNKTELIFTKIETNTKVNIKKY